MYERMLNRQIVPTRAEMTAYCGDTAELFTRLDDWLSATYATDTQIVFPYGNRYGWSIAHKIRGKLVCHLFAENNAFSVMVRLSDRQYASVYEDLQAYAQTYVDNKYPCGDGGWIHYRVSDPTHYDDIRKMLAVKCARRNA